MEECFWKWASLLWVGLGWVLSDREFGRRECHENSHCESVGGLLDLPAPSWSLSRMTQSGVCVMNADSCLAETIGCFNSILELLFYNYLSNCLCEYKVHVIYGECSHLKEKVANWIVKFFWWFYSLAWLFWALQSFLYHTGKYVFLPPTVMKWALLQYVVTLNSVGSGPKQPRDWLM